MSPIYQYKCVDCGAVREEIRCVADRDRKINCLVCGTPARREQTPVTGVVKNPAVPRRNK
jgi:putative FmdB family regulatory protein